MLQSNWKVEKESVASRIRGAETLSGQEFELKCIILYISLVRKIIERREKEGRKVL